MKRITHISNVFTTASDEAAESLAHISLVKVDGLHDAHGPPKRAITTYSHTRRMVKKLLQHFMDARLVAYATASKSMSIKERGIFVPTEKGLHVVEQYIVKHGIMEDNFRVFISSQVVCQELVHLERNAEDEMVLSNDAVYSIFRRFSGHRPNYHSRYKFMDTIAAYHARSAGVLVEDFDDKHHSSNTDIKDHASKHRFHIVSALDWLCDFISKRGRDEAAVISAHFVRCGLITMVSNIERKGVFIKFTVRGAPSPLESKISVSFIDLL